jgi:hypothetical protein
MGVLLKEKSVSVVSPGLLMDGKYAMKNVVVDKEVLGMVDTVSVVLAS